MRPSLQHIFRALLLIFFCAAVASAQTPPQSGAACECAETQTVKARLERIQTRFNDFGQLKRYADDNAKLAPPAKNEARVVFYGDSITDFWVRPEFGGFFPGKPYVDRGVSGQTTPQMLVRLRQDVIALAPKAVLILAGTNDIAGNTGPMTLEQIEANLATISELARAHGIRVILATLLPVSDYEHNAEGESINQTAGRPPAQILELNAWIKKYAAESGATYLDYFSAMVDDHGYLKADLSADGLHPNAAGYALMAPLAEKAIAAALKRKR